MHEAADVFDRRSASRVNSSLPATIRFQKLSGEIVQLTVQATDISEHGFALTTPEPVPCDTDINLKVILDKTSDVFEALGRCTSKNGLDAAKKMSYGFHIQHVSPESRRMLSSWLAKSLLNSSALKDRRYQRTIESKQVTYTNSLQQKIVGFVDSPIALSDSEHPFIVVAPGFGETKTSTLSLSFTLVKNGFRVLRYDPTNHTGESDGTIVDCTLSQLKQDILASIEFVRQEYNVAAVGLIVSSLSSVIGFSVAAEDPHIVFLGGLVPVVDLRSTLQAVYNEDLVGGYLAGKRWGIIDMLGFPIDSNRFLEDAIQGQYHTLDGIKQKIRSTTRPISCIVGSHDPWVSIEAAREAIGTPNSTRKIVVIENSMHQLHENPLASRTALLEITKAACSFMKPSFNGETIVTPRLREVAIQSRLEKERRRLISGVEPEQEVQFWADYLQRFRSISRVPDFREFYETIQSLIGKLNPHDNVLDAGCGNGSYGLWLLEAQQRAQHATAFAERLPYTYVGLDFVPGALANARQSHNEARSQLARAKGQSPEDADARCVYVLADLDRPLPFLDGYFQKICCNLVLSYVRHAPKALRELYRVLAPGGTLIITSLKPYADLSVVYRNFLNQADGPDDIAEAKMLLTNAGLIRSRESEGHFKFYSEAEISGMLSEMGIKSPTIVRSFANQANIAVIRKENPEC